MKNPDHYAVFGHPIAHSKSPQIHQLFARQTSQKMDYSALDVPAETFNHALNHFITQGGKGLNCTVPLKELAWQRADILTDRARISKAVNTLNLQADGLLLGDNTDGIGLVTDLSQNHGIKLSGLRVLILGAGGASRGIIGPIMAQSPQSVIIANRTVSKARQLSDEFSFMGSIQGCGFEHLSGKKFDLIINATSASLSGHLPPLPENMLSDHGCCYDLAYSNSATVFVLWGRRQKARKSLDGVGMLVEQAAEAFYIWRKVRPDTRSVIESINRERKT